MGLWEVKLLEVTDRRSLQRLGRLGELVVPSLAGAQPQQPILEQRRQQEPGRVHALALQKRTQVAGSDRGRLVAGRMEHLPGHPLVGEEAPAVVGGDAVMQFPFRVPAALVGEQTGLLEGGTVSGLEDGDRGGVLGGWLGRRTGRCSGQQNPDRVLDSFSAFAGGKPLLYACGLTQL